MKFAFVVEFDGQHKGHVLQHFDLWKLQLDLSLHSGFDFLDDHPFMLLELHPSIQTELALEVQNWSKSAYLLNPVLDQGHVDLDRLHSAVGTDFYFELRCAETAKLERSKSEYGLGA